jgi:ADP-ribose pyrophosphatase YjhB (NUDIX family)
VLVGCGCIVSDGEGRYLVVREAKASARGRWALPAGKLERGETLVEAAVREVREETGLEVSVDRLVGIWQCVETSEGFGVVNFVFAATIVGGLVAESAEHPEVVWLTRAEIRDLGTARRLRGSHVERALEAYERGDQTVVPEVVPASVPSHK